MKKIIISVLFLLGLSSYANTSNTNLQRTVDSSAQAKADKQLKKQNNNIVKLVVEEISKKLPIKIDKFTQFVNIKAENLVLISTYEINTGVKSDEAVKKEDKKRMQPFVIKGICQSSKRFLQSDIDISYIYTSASSKNELFRFEITAKDCKNFWQ